MSAQITPYGKWASPITAEHLSGGSINLEGVEANPSTGQIWALESRPADGGRSVIVEVLASASRDVLPAGYSAKSSIHEYGGGAFAIHPNGKLIFTNHPTNGVFLLDPQSGTVETIVTPHESVRFGNFDVYPPTQGWILAVQETHSKDSLLRPVVTNTIVAIHTATGDVCTVVQGADFYQHPQFSPDGTQVCWIQWDHPDMPWTGSVLHVATWEAGKLVNDTVISGQAGVESICQPRWGTDGTLFFVSDKTGYWQLYRFNGGEAQLINLKGLESAEFGSREPCLGNCTYVLLDKSTIVASATQNATSNLVMIDLETNSWKDLSLDLVDIQRNALARVSSTAFAVIGSTRTAPQALYRVDIGDSISISLIRATVEQSISSALISQTHHITFPRTYSGGSGNAHAMFAAPKNPAFEAPAGTLPPLLVWMHGGPTSHVTPALALKTQYWTSRGYAYVLVNHVGSTGYGRAYRELLDGGWGEADIADAASCVAYLAEEKLIDVNRVGIVGESAGGYAVLQALYTHPDVWTAGISLYGISSLQGFAEITHKFESQYILGLVLGKGEWTKEAREELYRRRSALYHAEKIQAPLLLLQGDVDTIVPVSQATQMEEAMKKVGKTAEVVIFKGEGHGWHKEETIRASMELQTEFWNKTLL
ncbi:hypothetical protein N7474_001727 [Penicillium riverlandense]|uniref:uncharacterized protein n=1 Tax=Penicillium riverlandense TaxID=1903569 RepID=UPI00254877CD|nr:uncharacterized protein N7474_001727 [Penicillium riverlandense]KAJ5833416.1 hypothetical protein N7474_001727 [Penicillium riverlandense]